MHQSRRAALLVDVVGRSCLIVGGGAAGASKASRLAVVGAHVTVVDPCPGAAVATDDRLCIERRAFRDSDVGGRWLVVAATDDAALNERVAAAAEAAGVWVNRADQADGGPACLLALLERGPVQVAIGTSGLSPAFGVWLRGKVAEAIGPEAGRLAELLAERGRGPSGRRDHRELPFDDALACLAAGDEDGARRLLRIAPAADRTPGRKWSG